MTRDEAVAAASEKEVAASEATGCEPTNVCGLNGACQGDDLTEWRARDRDSRVAVYYYTTNEQDQVMANNDGDGSAIDWEIAGYEVN
jgi:hypothetical protein